MESEAGRLFLGDKTPGSLQRDSKPPKPWPLSILACSEILAPPTTSQSLTLWLRGVKSTWLGLQATGQSSANISWALKKCVSGQSKLLLFENHKHSFIRLYILWLCLFVGAEGQTQGSTYLPAPCDLHQVPLLPSLSPMPVVKVRLQIAVLESPGPFADCP